jgi:hypothetical protein
MYLDHKLVCLTRLRVVIRGQYYDLKIIVLGLFGDDIVIKYDLIILYRDNPAQKAKIGGKIRFYKFLNLPRVHIRKKHGKGYFNAARNRRIKKITLDYGDLILRRELTDLRRTIIRLAIKL